MFQISIIRADGISDNLEYFLSLEGKVLQDLYQSSEPTYVIPAPGILQIMIKDTSKKYPTYTARFHTKILPSEGFQWVPLGLNKQEILEEFPEDVSNPRVLIMVSGDFLTPIDEISEIECENCELLKIEKAKLQQEINKLHKEAKISTDNFTAENEKNKVLMKKFQGLFNDCKKEVDIYKIRNEEERKKNIDFQEKISSLLIQIEENAQKAKMREEFLENIINDREKEYNKINMEKIRVKSSSINENERSIILTPNTESYLSVSTNSLQLGLLKETPSQPRLQTKRRVLSEIGNPQASIPDTHLVLKDYLKKTNRTGLFQRDQGNIFKFGKKKVYITVKHGNLLCRVGGGFENIEDFIIKNQEPKHSISPIDKLHRRNKTIDDLVKTEEDKELINSIYCRSSPEIEKLIQLKMRPSSNCNTE